MIKYFSACIKEKPSSLTDIYIIKTNTLGRDYGHTGGRDVPVDYLHKVCTHVSGNQSFDTNTSTSFSSFTAQYLQ